MYRVNMIYWRIDYDILPPMWRTDDSKFIIINHEVKEYRGLPKEETLIIPEGVRSIAPYVFSDRKYIKMVVFPESLLSIGEFAFVRCYGIKTLILPKGLKTIHTSAFSRCDNLKDRNPFN